MRVVFNIARSLKAENNDVSGLLFRARNGDAEAVAEIIGIAAPFINSRAVKFACSGCDKSDLVQEGMLALLRALKTYKEDKGRPFFNYAYVCITNALISEVRKLSQKKKIPVSCMIPIDEMDRELESCATDPQDEVIAKESARINDAKIKNLLSEFEYKVFKLYINGYSYKEMAELLCVSKKAVGNAACRLKVKIRQSDLTGSF